MLLMANGQVVKLNLVNTVQADPLFNAVRGQTKLRRCQLV